LIVQCIYIMFIYVCDCYQNSFNRSRVRDTFRLHIKNETKLPLLEYPKFWVPFCCAVLLSFICRRFFSCLLLYYSSCYLWFYPFFFTVIRFLNETYAYLLRDTRPCLLALLMLHVYTRLVYSLPSLEMSATQHDTIF